MGDGEWGMEDGEWRMENGEWRIRLGLLVIFLPFFARVAYNLYVCRKYVIPNNSA
jgi:hypothetical protein